MIAGPTLTDHIKRLRWIVAAAAALGVLIVALAILAFRDEAPAQGQTVGEKLAAFRAERASLAARADGEARIGLLPAFRVASLLSDALVVRHDSDIENTLDRLPAFRRQAFADVDALNTALKDALIRPGEGARLAARAAAERATAQLERLAGTDDAPLVLSFTPRFVPPRRATGELTLAPGTPGAAPRDGALRLDARPRPKAEPAVPTVPRYAPEFAGSGDEDPPVEVEIVGLHLSPGGPPPMLAIGAWRGEAALAPERLRFSVPRSAFAAEVARTYFSAGSLTLRRASRTVTFELLFVVLPDRPGSFALDQRVATTVAESKTLVSPEILARAAAGAARDVRRCFDPPAGWRFDKGRRRVVTVERLGWLADIGDATLNGGSVEFAADEGPDQICIVVTAKPVTKAARTATIGRFEATLVRDRPDDRVVQSGIRALDWREAVRLAIEPGAMEWKLYVRLFDEIDREFDGPAPAGIPFLHIARDEISKTLILQADPTAEP